MSDVTRILSAIEQGDPSAAEQLLPLVYDELRKLAAAKLAREQPGQTLQATALVHEAYLRLVGAEASQVWNSRGHFFAAAAEAMRRVLINRARDRGAVKRGGNRRRIDFDAITDALAPTDADLLDLNEGLEHLAREFPQAAQVVHLRCFAGSIPIAGRAEKGWAPPWRHLGFSLPTFSAASISFSSAASMTFSPGAPVHLWRMIPL